MHKRVLALATLAAAALTLAACGTSTPPSSTASSGKMAMPMTSSSAAPAHNAADVSFVQAMIPHHQQAIEMARLVPGRSSNPQIKALATRIEAAQGPEITKMTGWLTAWGAAMPTDMAGMDMPGSMSPADLDSLKKSKGSTFDKAFVAMMIVHHTSAVAMAQSELSQGSSAEAKALAQSISASQTKEITQMKALLTAL